MRRKLKGHVDRALQLQKDFLALAPGLGNKQAELERELGKRKLTQDNPGDRLTEQQVKDRVATIDAQIAVLQSEFAVMRLQGFRSGSRVWKPSSSWTSN